MSATTRTLPQSSKAVNVILWILQILLAAAFLMSGAMKFTNNPEMIEGFNKIGIGQWFRYATGVIEIVSAVMLVIPRLVPIGAFLLICTMIGAAIAHLTVLGGSPIAPLVLLALSAIIFWGRRGRLAALAGRR